MPALALAMIFAGLLFLVSLINQAAIGLFLFLGKVGVMIYLMTWIRATFPRFRYDQVMNIGWKYMIPIGMGAILVDAVVGMLRVG